jgi:hypothetical protein
MRAAFSTSTLRIAASSVSSIISVRMVTVGLR